MDERIEQLLLEMEGCLYPTGYSQAIIRYVQRCGGSDVILLSREKCIEITMEMGMDRMEAIEYFEFNVLGSYMGNGTPAFAVLLEDL